MSDSTLPATLAFQGNGGTYPPHGIITAIDHGPAVVVATWILMCLMALGVIARFGTRFATGDKENITICTACGVYASQILKILIHYLAKLSLVLVFIRLTPSKRTRQSLWLFVLSLTVWSGVAIITHAVQCPPPRWNISASGCLNQGAIYTSYGVINIFTDLVIVLIPLALLWKVQIGQDKKRAIYAVFVVRLV
ncbi:MAG: hypothetical protein Q9207_005510 [Kuettlingeria erythrocarpa]